jgi:hypothetical protein
MLRGIVIRRTIMIALKRCLVLAAIAALAGCASNPFVSSWKAPDAQPLQMQGAKVAAVVMMQNEASRRAAEDALAREITARGAVGVPMYTIYPDTKTTNEPAAKAALEAAGVKGIVVMRPVSVSKEVESTPVMYSGPMYGGYWGGYYGAGWGAPYGMGTVSGGDIRTNTIVQVETLVYSLAQNKLVWGGQSKMTNPTNVDKVIKQLAEATTKELQKQGLIPAA